MKHTRQRGHLPRELGRVCRQERAAIGDGGRAAWGLAALRPTLRMAADWPTDPFGCGIRPCDALSPRRSGRCVTRHRARAARWASVA